jgi:formylglycine-generating enzyme required for sulfatase activity
MKFVPLPRATFYMGWDGTKKRMKMEIKEEFEIAVHMVTQEQWQAVMGNNPSFFSRDGRGKDKGKDIPGENLKLFPVEQVSWNDAQEFIKVRCGITSRTAVGCPVLSASWPVSISLVL